MGKNQPLIAVYHHLSVEPVRHIGSPPEEGHREVSTHSQSAEVSTDVKDVVARFVQYVLSLTVTARYAVDGMSGTRSSTAMCGPSS